jgi:hypothetical protein
MEWVIIAAAAADSYLTRLSEDDAERNVAIILSD